MSKPFPPLAQTLSNLELVQKEDMVSIVENATTSKEILQNRAQNVRPRQRNYRRIPN